MKNNRTLITLILPTMLLSSCGSASYKGSYVFQMGKDNGTHFGVNLVVDKQNELVYTTREGEEVRKALPDDTHEWFTFWLSFDLNLPQVGPDTETPQDPPQDSNPSSTGEIKSLLNEEETKEDDFIFGGVEDLDIDIHGFFYVKHIKNQNEEYNVMKLSNVAVFGYELSGFDGLLDLIVTAKITHSKAILTIPVSIPDLTKQIEWMSSQGDNYIEGSKPEKNSEGYFYTVDVALLKQ